MPARLGLRGRLLRLLVVGYPPAFRQRFGAELTALLDDLLKERRPAPGPGTLRITADLLASAAAEWRCALLLRPERIHDSPAAVRARLRGASPQRTAVPPEPPFTPLPSLRRRHGGGLPPRAPTMR